jgi:hypothetical protein
MNKPTNSKQRTNALVKFSWLTDLDELIIVDGGNECVEIQESDIPEQEPDTLSFEEFELQCYDDLMRIHSDALHYRMSEQAYAVVTRIVKAWREFPRPQQPNNLIT